MKVILCSVFFLELPTPGSLFAYTLTVLATEGKIETGCLRELAGLGFDASSTWCCLCRHSFNHMFAWFRILLPSLNVGEEEGKGNEGSAAVQWLWRGEKTQVDTSLHREGCLTYQWYSVLLLVLLLGLTVSTCYLLSPPNCQNVAKPNQKFTVSPWFNHQKWCMSLNLLWNSRVFFQALVAAYHESDHLSTGVVPVVLNQPWARCLLIFAPVKPPFL